VFEPCLGAAFSAPVQTGPRVHQNPLKCVPVHLSYSKEAVSCGNDHPRRLEPRLKKVEGCRAIPLLPPSLPSFHFIGRHSLFCIRHVV